jgi:hypothetical protein
VNVCEIDSGAILAAAPVTPLQVGLDAHPEPHSITRKFQFHNHRSWIYLRLKIQKWLNARIIVRSAASGPLVVANVSPHQVISLIILAFFLRYLRVFIDVSDMENSATASASFVEGSTTLVNGGTPTEDPIPVVEPAVLPILQKLDRVPMDPAMGMPNSDPDAHSCNDSSSGESAGW